MLKAVAIVSLMVSKVIEEMMKVCMIWNCGMLVDIGILICYYPTMQIGKVEMENEMNLNLEFSDNLIKKNIDKGEFGLEKESLRVDGNGFLSHTKHPFEEQSNITRDFCENQIELITDVFDNVHDVLFHLEELQRKVLRTLQQLETGKEYLWPFSNPPYVKGEDDIPIAQFEGEWKQKTEYRNYLAEKYGKKKMLFSGIHLNYSFAGEMIKEGYQAFLSRAERISPQNNISTYQLYKNQLYLQLAQKVIRYSWFIVYLTAASPVMDASVSEEKDNLMQYASVRCGKAGYWNDFTPVFHYRDLETYLKSLEAYVKNGQLRSVSELYYPVRLKPRGENSLEHLRENGINHIELRMLDVNPLSPIGLLKEDVEFIHYFLLYLMRQEDIRLTEEEQRDAIINEKQAAKFDDSKIIIKESDGNRKQIRKAALEILRDMEIFYEKLGKGSVLENIRYQKHKLLIPDNRYADRIRRGYGTDYVKRGICLAKEYTEQLLTEPCVKELLTKWCV